MAQKKVAVVTGANKGIGYAIVRGLCKRFDGIVYLTSRNETLGRKALIALQSEGLPSDPLYHQLDITKPESVERFRDHLKKEHGGFDLLINNAAIAFKNNATEPVAVQAEETLFVNYFSVLSTCEILFPILRDGARVVNVSSSAGHLSNIPSKKLRDMFQDPALTIPQLSELMRCYIEAAKQGTQIPEWGNSSYVVSKVGLTALTKIQQRLVNDRSKLIFLFFLLYDNLKSMLRSFCESTYVC